MSNLEKSNKNRRLSRRNFLFGVSKSLASLAVASAGVYVVGSAFKSLDGSLVAGAKTCTCTCRKKVMCGAPLESMFDEVCTIETTAPVCSSLNGVCTSGYNTMYGPYWVQSCP
jgi:hypothetical protein